MSAPGSNGNGKLPCRIGLYICHCGTNISKMVDVVKLADEFASHPLVAVSRHYKFMCSEPGQEQIVSDIKAKELDRLVVAACSPLMHELTFRAAVERGGLNRYLFEMVNIREQVSWVTTDYASATQKARALNRGALARVALHEPLDMRRVPIGKHPRIKLMTWAEVEEVNGYIGNFKVKVRRKARYVDPAACNSCGSCYEACPSHPYPRERVLMIGNQVLRRGMHMNPE